MLAAGLLLEDLFWATFGHRRRHVYRAGIGVPVLKMTALTRAFQRCVAHAGIPVAYAVMCQVGFPAATAAAMWHMNRRDLRTDPNFIELFGWYAALPF